MIRIGITGQSGFIGTHLFNTLGLYPGTYDRIPFNDEFFNNKPMLCNFVRNCDIIVHLAAMNRHSSPKKLYEINISLVEKLINACEDTGSSPYLLFSSSTQEDRNNLYGESKRRGRMLFEKWALRNNASFSGLIIPNVFGPFGNPYYNSVVATFCHQLTHGEQPGIDVDGDLNLIYIGELISEILGYIEAFPTRSDGNDVVEEIHIKHRYEIKVSQLLEVLTGFRENYLSSGIIPSIDDPLTLNLFNTFLCYIDHQSFFPFNLNQFTDERGSFIETAKLNSGGQVSFSTTRPGITRGNHFHTRKAERFAVIRGQAQINLRRIGTEKILSFIVDGNNPSFVDMPIWFTHNIINTGTDELFTMFWINEHYDSNDPDTFFEKV